ncbi:phosphatidylserine decarboxylase [Verrucomicrobium sp. GAS474]|uniref:phosphatidylserine decarboxylase n=1 Tax=Verrucomicrobium sp. GAS474 TaxID=1882831 RepID=UPI00087AE1CE|nr:phosphatidylserine decarboxylase [Verrucomicrobium sp. GAS474]SDU07413.1 phosphatidylserine decarboxylase [Verrucomicrobium sp. GAS474]
MASARTESFKILIPLGIAILLALFFLHGLWAGIVGGLLIGLFVFCLNFFRDPERTAPDDPALMISSADGVVTHVEVVEESPFGLGKMKRISVFLNVFDVHVNRTFYGGTIVDRVHVPGKFLDARHPTCHVENERMDWHLQTEHGPIVLRQIAGLIARRIVGWAEKGQEVVRGERIGMIRFGSRTDLFMPLHCEVLVKVGERVKGGETPLARWTPSNFDQMFKEQA